MKNNTTTAAAFGPVAPLARTVTPAQIAAAMPDDDEIVYPVSSQSSDASTSPELTGDNQRNTASFRQEHNNVIYDSKNNGLRQGHSNDDPFQEDFVLKRGDAGTKEWAPLPTVPRARPRGRGHRSTKSEPPMPTPMPPRGPKAKLQPVKESWADDMNGLEEHMNRVKLESTPTRPGSTPGAGASSGVQSATSTPRKQRSQKKQKSAQRARGASVPGTRSSANSTTANTKTSPTPSSASSESTPSPTQSATPGKAGAAKPGSPKKKPKKGKNNKNRSKKEDVAPQLAHSAPSTTPSTPRGLGRRSIVDDVSENGDFILPPQSVAVQHPQTEADRLLNIAYDEAVKFMNAFIENPDYYTSRASRLTFLQALIVELGLVSAAGPERTLPGSLNAAKALLKSHAFLNVKDYLTLREQGVDALRAAMRPSRSALVRDLRGKNGRRAKLNWVKETGLNVLLVSCNY